MSHRAGGPPAPETAEHSESQLLRHSAVMAAGTVVSRASGLVRSVLLAAALGSGLNGDVFNVANTIPTMLYILLAGGIFNAVLVPQLVRALRQDDDGGQAYTDRVVTAFGLLLALATVALVVAAPWLVRLYVSDSWSPGARESLVDLTRYCLPQVFFYGIFVLVGQVLNARGRFGPMMWAPIANNAIATVVLVGYLVTFGPGRESPGVPACVGFDSSRELVLGLGSTAGIVAQLLILLPYLRSAGYTLRPRLDLRGTGLGQTFRLGVWTLLFVLVNQVAYLVVVRLATSGTAATCSAVAGAGAGAGADPGTGYTVYSNSFLLVMVPHSIVTVSLATALLPLLSARAAAGDLRGLATALARTLRTALAVVVPVAALLPVIAGDVGRVLFGAGAGATTAGGYGPTLAVFGVAFVAFTVHYLVLRGFYALERNRVVFLVQCGVASTNIAVAVLVVGRTDAASTAPALALAYGCAYLVGATVSYAVLSRIVGGLDSIVLLRFMGRLLVSVAVGVVIALGLREVLPDAGTSQLLAAVRVGALGLVDVVVVVVIARVLRIDELQSVVGLVVGRVGVGRFGKRSGAHRSTLSGE